ncbi:MAG: hypothetical protein WDO24_02635 [Pseudomonadota bacterium]
MSVGWIEQLGAPKDIYDRPETLFVADFIGQMNKLPAGSEPPRTAIARSISRTGRST